MRPIDAEAFQKFIEKQDESADYTIYHFEEWLEQQPTIEAKPVVHAHWEGDAFGVWCSRCEKSALWNCYDMDEESKFCPHCGAQMDEEVSK